MLHKSEYRIYNNSEEITENAEKFEFCVNNGNILDIITLESDLYIKVNCKEDIITLQVPGYTTIKEIHDVYNFVILLMSRLF